MIITITDQQKADIVAALAAKLAPRVHTCPICLGINIEVPQIQVNDTTKSYYAILGSLPLIKSIPFMCDDCGHDMTHEISQLGLPADFLSPK
jgi:hypothetical protein